MKTFLSLGLKKSLLKKLAFAKSNIFKFKFEDLTRIIEFVIINKFLLPLLILIIFLVLLIPLFLL